MVDLVQDIVTKTLATSGSKTVAHTFMQAFFKELKENEQQLPVLMTEKKTQEIAMMLHKLAGACGYFGANELHDITLAVEKIARQEDVAALQIQLPRVLHALKQVIEKEQVVIHHFG